MQKDIGVYVTKKDLKNNLLHREYQLYSNRIVRRDGSSRYGEKVKDFAVQYNSEIDNVVCGCKLSRPKRHHETRYVITTPGSVYRSRSYVDIGVGSIRKLPKKRVRKVHLPEMSEQGVGSTDLTQHFRKNRHNNYSYYSRKKTSAKCVGGFIESTAGYVVSEKLSPITQVVSGYTSPSLARFDIRKPAKTLRDTEIGSSIVNNQLTSASIQVEKSRHEYKSTHAGNSTVNQLVMATTQFEVEIKRESKSKHSLRRTPTKAGISYYTGQIKARSLNKTSKTCPKAPPLEVRTEKILSSDTILQVHNLEINSERKFEQKLPTAPEKVENDEKIISNEVSQKKDSVIVEDMSNTSKESTVKPISGLKNMAILKRRFDALRRTLCKKDDSKKVVKSPSRHTPVSKTSSQKCQRSRMDVSIASDPPSLVARSFGELSVEPNNLTSKHSSKKSFTEGKQESSYDVSSKYNTLDSEASHGVNGMLKLWGKKFNLESNPDVEDKNASSYIKSITKVNEENMAKKPPLKEKEKKRFFFFKSRTKESTKWKEKEDIKSEDDFMSKQGITTGRCEVKDGFSIRLGGTYKQKSIMVKKNEPKKRRESPGELLRQDWLMKYSANPKESCNSVKLRWNNGTYLTSSSTVDVTEKAYDTDNLLKSASDISVTTYSRSSHFIPKQQQTINYMQLYQAYMIPRLIDNRPIVPCRSENYGRNMDVAFLDRQWFIDKSKAFAHQLELILHTKNFSRFNRKVSSDYITIDNIPKDFFSDSSTDDNTPTHPMRSSDEEVYNIVEYETPRNSSVMKININTILKIDPSVQVARVTESVQKQIDEPLQKCYKDKPIRKDMETQRSAGNDPNNVFGISVITKRELSNARTPYLRCMDCESDKRYGNLHAQHSERIFEFDESYSQENYPNWMPMDLFSWCISDTKFKCHSYKDACRSIGNVDCTKSCPNIHEEFVTSNFMSSFNIISTNSPYYNIQTKKTSYEKLKSVKFLPQRRSSSRFVTRIIPKDSLEVLKKRKNYATRKNWASFEEPAKKYGKEVTGKKHVSLGFDKIIEEILSPVTSRSKQISKRTLPSDKPSYSFSLVSDPETISTHSHKASKRSLKSLAVATKQFMKLSHSSTPRLSPKQSNPKVSCSGLKMGVMGILPMESPQNYYSSVDCLRSSVSKISSQKDSDHLKKYSVHTAQSQQNYPVSSLVILSNSQSLPLVVIESFEPAASKCVNTQGTNEAFVDNVESKYEKILKPKRDNSTSTILSYDQNTKDIYKNTNYSYRPKCEIIKGRGNKSNISLKSQDKKKQDMYENLNNLYASKLESVKGTSRIQSKSSLISKESKRKEIMKCVHDLLTSNFKSGRIISRCKSDNSLMSKEENNKQIMKNIYDLRASNFEFVKLTRKVKSDSSLICKAFASNDLTSKSSFSKEATIHTQKTSAISLCWRTSGGTSARKVLSVEQNVFHQSHRSREKSDCNVSMNTQHNDVVQISSHEKITIKIKHLTSSTEEIGQSKSEEDNRANGSLAKIKHEVNHWEESAHNCDELSTYTDKDTFKTYDIKKITKDSKLQSNSATSVANIIEIDFKLKVTDGDKSTEVHIGNDGNVENKKNDIQTSQHVLVMNKNEPTYPISEHVTKDTNGNKDINIKIMIKNFKSKTNSGIGSRPHKPSKHYIDFSNKISGKFQTVSASENSNMLYSTHKATVDLTVSGNSGELIELNNDISHHLSDIIMRSNVTTSESFIYISDIKSATETSKKKMSIFGKITGKTKERFRKGQEKLSKRSKSYTQHSENGVGLETSTDVDSKASNNSKSIKSIYRRAMGQKTHEEIDESTNKLSDEFPSEYESRSKYQEKKELLKKVFQTANCLGKRNTKSRMRKLKTILKSVLTSDSSDPDLSLAKHHLNKEITDTSLTMRISSYTSLNSIANKIDDHHKCCNKKKDASLAEGESEHNIVLDSNENYQEGCICLKITDKLNMCGALETVGCCCSKPTAKNEETNCNLANAEPHNWQISKAALMVDVETQKSTEYISRVTNMSRHEYSDQSIARVTIVDKELKEEAVRESHDKSTKSASNVEKIEFTVKDIEIPVTSVDFQNENNDLLNSNNIKEAYVTQKVETTVRKASKSNKKIVITIDNFKNKSEYPIITRKDDTKMWIPNSKCIKNCEFKKLDRNTKLGISDDDKIIFLESESTNAKCRVRHKHKKQKETNEHPYIRADILQLYETKKAVLQIYAEKRRTANGKKFVANLPVFMANKESEIYRNYGDLINHAYCNFCENVMF